MLRCSNSLSFDVILMTPGSPKEKPKILQKTVLKLTDLLNFSQNIKGTLVSNLFIVCLLTAHPDSFDRQRTTRIKKKKKIAQELQMSLTLIKSLNHRFVVVLMKETFKFSSLKKKLLSFLHRFFLKVFFIKTTTNLWFSNFITFKC